MIEYSQYDSPMSPQSFMSVLFRRRKIIITLFLCIVATVVGFTYILPPVFESSAKVMVNYQGEQEKDYLLGSHSTDENAYNRLGSEVVIMKSGQVLKPVITRLGLDVIRNKENAKASQARLQSEILEQLRQNLVVEREKDTNILNVSFSHQNPNTAAQITKAVVSEYLNQRPKLAKDDRAFAFFDDQIKKIKSRINAIESNSWQFKKSEQVMVPDKQSEILFSQIADYDKELTRIRSKRISKEARLKVIMQQVENGEQISLPNTDASESLSKMDYLNELRKTLLQLQLKKSSMAKRYTEKHPEMEVVAQDIQETKAKIDAEISKIIQSEKTGIEALRATETEMADRMKKVANSVADLSRQEYELGMLTIGIDDLKEVYSMLIRQREQARIAASKREHMVQVRVLEPASVPYAPAWPNKPLLAALAIVLGVIVSLGVAFFVEYFDHSVNTVEDAQNCLGLPILAAISDADSRLLAQPMPRHVIISQNYPQTQQYK